MAGLDKNTPLPVSIVAHQQSRVLEIAFNNGSSFRLPYEYLRVYSPSAEVKGHGPGQETLQLNKEDVAISEIEGVGNYAIQPKFSDGHATGIYSWDYLFELGRDHESLWQSYLDKLAAAGHVRKSTTPVATTSTAAPSKKFVATALKRT